MITSTLLTETLVDEEESPLEEGNCLFFFNVNSFLDDNHLKINRNDYHDHNDNKNISRNNYDYILKHNPKIGEPKDWKNVVPKHYHNYHDVFTKKELDKLPERRPWDHAIELNSNFKPIDCKIYSLSPEEQRQLKLFIEENLRTGRIQPSKSPMASPIFFVKKKDGSLHPTQDYHKLNDATIKNRYPLPLISDLTDNLMDTKVFSKMDVRWGYNNICIKEGDEWKAAFRTNLGLFKPTVMFFGLTNSPATFQNFMNHIFKPLIYRGVVAIYMDDILVFTETHEQHQQVIKEVLDILRQNNLFLKPEKCVFERPEVDYLGIIIGHGQVKMDPAKILAIQNWPILKTVKQVQSFLGFANFYRRFIKNFSKIALPLTTLTKKDTTWDWTTNQQNTFDTLITTLTSEPVLALPRPKGQF